MKNRIKEKRLLRIARRRRVRAKIFGTAERPRLSVFRSHNHIYAQLIDDATGKTLVAASDINVLGAGGDNKDGKASPRGAKKTQTKSEMAALIGKKLAQIAQEKQIKKVIFDRGGFAYHGRIKALADAAREAGLEF